MRQSASYAILSESERLALLNEPVLSEVRWQAIASPGTTNHLFRANSPWGPVVLRLNTSGRRSYGVDRQREATLLSHIQGCSWAPTVQRNKPDQGWMLMTDYGDGQPTATGEQWQVILSQWHQITAIPSIDYQRLIASYAADLPDTLAAKQLVQNMTQTLAALPDQHHCLVHHDLHPGNLVGSDSQWRVIDWEYAGRGCPWLDLAAVQRHWGLDAHQVALMPIAQGYTPEQISGFLTLAHQMNALLEKAWWWVRGLAQQP